MTNINNILERPYVDNGSYTVPNGYFNTLHDRIMERVDKESLCSKNSTMTSTTKMEVFSMKPWFKYAAAACLIAAVSILGIGVFYHQNDKENHIAEQQDAVITEQYYNDCMEYAMVDNDDIYTYLAEQ